MEVGLVTFPGEVPRLLEHVGSEMRCTRRCYQHSLVIFACLLVTQRETQLEMSMSPPLHTHTHTHTHSLKRSLCFLVAGGHRGSESLLRWFIIILQDLPGDFQAAALAVHMPHCSTASQP